MLIITIISPAHTGAQGLLNANKEVPFGSEIMDSSHDISYNNSVNEKVLKNFRRFIGDKPDVAWLRTPENNLVAYYKENNRMNYVYFSNRGVIDHTISHYGEDQLSKDVRQIVKSNFHDYSITHVSETHKDDATWLYVTVMDKSSIKTIRVIGEECDVVAEILRQ